MTTTFYTYNGSGSMRQRLQAAVVKFYKGKGNLPGIIVTHPSELAEAQEAATALELAAEVRASGGCLVPWVWLGEGEAGG